MFIKYMGDLLKKWYILKFEILLFDLKWMFEFFMNIDELYLFFEIWI